ncbi:MAG: hypothetical protein J0L92_30325 [Deltaproteobacteria bacterium]|nr:hypothetical protein [Deltaproteobacteria bacterium]
MRLAWAAAFASVIASCGERTQPVEVPYEPPPPPQLGAPLDHVMQMEIGTLHGCALIDGGEVWCWGWPDAIANTSVESNQHLARRVEGLRDVVEIRAGGKQTCARTHTDELWCWGERFDAPGVSDPNVVAWDPLRGPPDSILPRFHPRPIRVAIEGLVAFDVGRAHACAIDGARVLRCWGSNANDEIGGYADPSAPHRVADAVIDLDAGPFYTCFTRETGQERVTRRPGRDRDVVPAIERVCLGAPPEIARTAPRQPITLEDTFASIACVIEDGRARCETVGAWAPADFAIPDASDVRAIALGAYHGCLAHEDGRVQCWGQSMMGQLGPAPASTAEADARVRTIEGVSALALGAGPYRTCALTTGAGVVCWGDNERGACGAEAFTRTAPVTVVRRPL